MPETPPPDSFRERLARLDTCVVSDALDRLGLTGVVTGISRLSTDRAVAVAPGDWVLADGSGIVFLAAADAERILAAAEQLAAKERAMVEDIRAGAPVSKVMAGNYERMLQDK
jgi:hypothetical protein